MAKNLKLMLVAFVVCLMAGTVMAGTTTVNHGAAETPIEVSYATLGAGANRVFELEGVGTEVAADDFAISYELGQQLTSGNLLQVEFSGAAFDGTEVNVCAANDSGVALGSAQVIGTATPASGRTTHNIQIDVDEVGLNVGAGNIIWITTHTDCITNAAANFSGLLSPQTSAADATVTMGIVTSGGIEVDAESTDTVADVATEWAVAMSAGNTVTIDFLAGPADGTTIETQGGSNVLAAAGNAVVITKTAMDVDANAGAQNAGFTVGVSITVEDSLSWAGINRVFITTDTCTTSLAANTSPSGAVTLSDAANFTGAADADFDVCLNLDGSVQAQRTITGYADVNILTGGANNDPAAVTSSTLQTWTVNGYTAVVPYLSQGSSYPTYCVVSNSTANDAIILLDVLSSEGTIDSTLTNQTIGTLSAQKTGLLKFSGNEVSLDDGTAVDISGMGTDNRYMARLTVTAGRTEIFMTCMQTDPKTTGKRFQAPLTQSVTGGGTATSYEWKN